MTTLLPEPFRTTTACRILRSMQESGDFSPTPLLLDAMFDAGASLADCRDVLMAWVCAEPENDEPRLRFADAVEEAGEVELAEFIRLQVEVARLPDCKHSAADGKLFRDGTCAVCSLRWQAHELLHTHYSKNAHRWAGDTVNRLPVHEYQFDRGFVSWVSLSWSDFLAHHRALLWSPVATDECQRCRGRGNREWGAWADPDPVHSMIDTQYPYLSSEIPCCACSGSGRVPRPFPTTTAQPITEVRLTDWPNQLAGLFPNTPRFTTQDGVRNTIQFDRMKCPTCDGTGRKKIRHGRYDLPSDYVQCPSCHGQPPNDWSCGEWANVRFVMPETP